MDIKMPKVDRLEVLRRIRRDPELRVLPVVMLTSSRAERDLAAAYDLGANACVVKPMDFHSCHGNGPKVGAVLGRDQ